MRPPGLVFAWEPPNGQSCLEPHPARRRMVRQVRHEHRDHSISRKSCKPKPLPKNHTKSVRYQV